MARIIIVMILSMSMVTCGVAQRRSDRREMSAIGLKEVAQLFNLESMKLVDFGGTIDIIYVDDFVIYHHADTVYAIREGTRKPGVPDTLTSPYIVFKKGQDRGRLYKFLHAMDYQDVQVDSAIGAMMIAKERIFQMDPVFRLVDAKGDSGGGLLERYVPIVKKDGSYPDSAYLYFKKDLLDVDFSLSRKLETSKEMKLLSARFVYLPSVDSSSGKQVPQREMSFQISRKPVADKQKIMQFLERVEKSL